ncbi:unnamed protein product [Prorocentrum cordatum]|uniref:Uncharacterized protein n=1 Tax=Prorocentrum cordatum TaxID=2364126 RepID=A0ABN9Q7N1_9DINO|nr:unnamed protein product [Polarella glacialis]
MPGRSILAQPLPIVVGGFDARTTPPRAPLPLLLRLAEDQPAPFVWPRWLPRARLWSTTSPAGGAGRVAQAPCAPGGPCARRRGAEAAAAAPAEAPGGASSVGAAG